MRIKLDKAADIKKSVDKAIFDYTVKVVDYATDKFHADLRKIVGDLIEKSSVFVSLKSGGPLYGQVGIKSPTPNLNKIKETIVENVYVDVRARGKHIDLVFGVLQDDYGDILALPESEYMSVNSAGRARRVPWLYWLLTADQSPVTPKYAYITRLTPEQRSRSRTTVGLMKRIDEGSSLRPFSFSAEYAGDENDNFLTRALNTSEFQSKVETALEEAIFDAVAKNPTG